MACVWSAKKVRSTFWLWIQSNDFPQTTNPQKEIRDGGAIPQHIFHKQNIRYGIAAPSRISLFLANVILETAVGPSNQRQNS